MKFLIMVDIFPIFLLEWEIYCQDRFEKLIGFFYCKNLILKQIV